MSRSLTMKSDGRGGRRELFRSGPFGRAYAQAVRAGDVVHVAGQVATDAQGAMVGAGDLVTQVRQVYANAAAALAMVGGGLPDVAAETWFVTDMADFVRQSRAIFEIRRQAYGDDPPVTQTVVQVTALYQPDLLVEVQFTAHL